MSHYICLCYVLTFHIVNNIWQQKGTSRIAAEEWKERNSINAPRKYFSLEANLNSHIGDALPHEKANEISLRKVRMF